MGRKSNAEVGSYAFAQWVWIDFYGRSNGAASKDAASNVSAGRDLERFDNLAVDAVVTELDALL